MARIARSVTQSLAPAQAAVTSLSPGALIDGVYRVERLLGEGSGGAVYLVRHEGLDGARFALKVAREQPGHPADLLLREGRLAAAVRSAHVVKVTAVGRLPGGAPYLVMEYVEGPTLEELLDGRSLLPELAVECGRQLCLALEAAHEQGLLHGDISLRNVFATPKPDGSIHLQLGDFGLVRRLRRASETMSVELGGGRGTPRFMGPEVIAGDHADERSEVFAAGVVLYRLLCGAFPFDGASAREILTATLRGEPAPLSQQRAGLGALEPVVMRCLEPDPAARYPSARALREALEATVQAEPPAVEPPPRRRSPRAAAAAILLAVAAAASSWAGVGFWREHARIPIGTALSCPDVEMASGGGDADLAHAVAQATCARVGAALDLDWGGGTAATVFVTRLRREAGAYRLDIAVEGRRETARGDTPRAAAIEAARRLLARAARPPMSAAEVRYWGARDEAGAAAARAVWRRRTAMVIGDYEREPRAALAQDPELPLMHLLLAEVERDPARRREAQEQAVAHADRLPPERAAAVRAAVAVQRGQDTGAAIEHLRQAYTASPDDLDIAILYLGALQASDRVETALAVAEHVHARFPRLAALGVHHATMVPDQAPGARALQVGWLLAALPEARGLTDDVCLLVGTGRLEEADASLAFARRFGTSEDDLAIPAAVAALAAGDPPRIEQATVGYEGTTRSWSQVTAAHLRLAGLLLRGHVAAAQSFLREKVTGRRAAGDEAGALRLTAMQLQLARRTGVPGPDEADLDRLEQGLSRAALGLGSYAFARSELILWQAGKDVDAARAGLQELDAEIARRAGADALALAGAQLRSLALARRALGDAAAAARWREAQVAWLDDRVVGAYEAGLALWASGQGGEAEGALRLAASAYSIDRHPLESVAARVWLSGLLEARGDAAGEARALRGYVDRAWAAADPGLRERLRRGD